MSNRGRPVIQPDRPTTDAVAISSSSNAIDTLPETVKGLSSAFSSAFQHLQEDLVAVAQYAGDAALGVVALTLRQNGGDELAAQRLGGAACIEQADQHDGYLTIRA
jgi:hypothetical protein